MASTTTIRVSTDTRRELKILADARGQTLAQTVERGLALLRQQQMGRDLTVPLSADELSWLDAAAG